MVADPQPLIDVVEADTEQAAGELVLIVAQGDG